MDALGITIPLGWHSAYPLLPPTPSLAIVWGILFFKMQCCSEECFPINTKDVIQISYSLDMSIKNWIRGRPYSVHAVFWPFLTPSPPLHAGARIWLTPPLEVCTRGQYPPSQELWYRKVAFIFYMVLIGSILNQNSCRYDRSSVLRNLRSFRRNQ